VAEVVGERHGLGQLGVEVSAAETVRATCATSMEWVRRVRK
jgi:hypothetical protein